MGPFSFPVVKMRVELCSYSGYKIYPGRGKRMVKADGRVFNFLSHKCERSHTLKRNPREITWTVLYRRKHKKGQQEELVKKRTRRTQKFARAVAGATLSDIMAKRNQKSVRLKENRLSGHSKKNRRLKKLPRKQPRHLQLSSNLKERLQRMSRNQP